MSDPIPANKVPARYVGPHPVLLSAAGGPYYDAEGTRRETLALRPGDTLCIYDHEAFGQTLKWDPSNNLPPLWLGPGRIVLPEHAEQARDADGNPRAPLSDDELGAAGYEFQEGRRDFEPLITVAEHLARRAAEAEDAETVPADAPAPDVADAADAPAAKAKRAKAAPAADAAPDESATDPAQDTPPATA